MKDLIFFFLALCAIFLIAVLTIPHEKHKTRANLDGPVNVEAGMIQLEKDMMNAELKDHVYDPDPHDWQ